MAKKLGVSDRSVRRILKNVLKVQPYKFQKAHGFTENQKKVRLQRAKKLLRLAESGQFPNIVFSDEKIFPHFISTTQWLSNSPDANPMDYSLWAILGNKIRVKKYTSLEALKKSIFREWAKIPECHIRSACDSFVDRLKAIVKAKGGHIEPK